MPRPKGSEKPAGSGRRAGTPNKATAEVKTLARVYGAEAVTTLAGIMRDKEQPTPARVAAARELLDRGYGKAPQAHTDGDGGNLLPAVVMHRLVGGEAKGN